MAGNIDRKVLAHYVAELTELERQRADIANDVRAKLRSAKAAGLAPEALRVILREQKLPPDVRSARYRILDEYRAALGMLADTPLGEAAAAREAETILGRPHKPRKVIFDADTPLGEAAMQSAEVIQPEWPRPFVEQTVHEPKRRGRPGKVLFDQEHPQGTA